MSEAITFARPETGRLAIKRRALREAFERRAQTNTLVRGDMKPGPFANLAESAMRIASRTLAVRERLSPRGNEVQRLRGLRYGHDRRQSLDVYACRGAARAPVIVFFYGGAWRSGDKADFEFVGRALARLGFVVVIGDQRLVPFVRFPDFVEDSAEIVAWTQRNAETFGGDPTHLLLTGHSAGAYNAVMLGLDARYLARRHLSLDAIKGIVGLSGPYDFYPFPLKLCEEAFGCAPQPLDTQPVNFARAGAPPLLIIAGGRDTHVPSENSISLYEAQKAAGGECSLRWHDQASHLDTLIGLSRLAKARAPVLDDVLTFAASVGVAAPFEQAQLYFGSQGFPLPELAGSGSG